MIELRTGVPGSGKTLSAVERLSILVKRWSIHPDEARPIFVSGIPNLVLPHSEMPLRSVQINKAGSPSLVPDWDSMPDGSLVIIDECQGCFPPRSSASQSPEHVAWLNTHRHRGFDIWLMTQHPKLIDGTVRALVGKHQHYRRLFGGLRAAVYEWDCCSDSLSGMKTAVISYWPYPKKVYKWYKSAEIHNKQSFKLPRWLLIPLAGVVMALFFFPRAFAVLSSGISGKGISSAPAASASVSEPLVKPNSSAPQVGALAPAVGAEMVDFTKPYKAVGDEVFERPVSQLKIADGFYGDDPTEAPHFSASQLQVQARSVAVLEKFFFDTAYVARLSAYQADRPVTITFNEPAKHSGYR